MTDPDTIEGAILHIDDCIEIIGEHKGSEQFHRIEIEFALKHLKTAKEHLDVLLYRRDAMGMNI